MPEVDDWVTPTAAGPPPEPVDDWVTPKSTAAHDDWITPEPEKPEAEGILSTFGRSFAHEAPAVVAGAAGALYGGALGAPAGPVGAIGGALVGGFAGGYAGGAIGEQAYKAVGVDDAIQRAINAKTNPWSAAAGQAAAQKCERASEPANTGCRSRSNPEQPLHGVLRHEQTRREQNQQRQD